MGKVSSVLRCPAVRLRRACSVRPRLSAAALAVAVALGSGIAAQPAAAAAHPVDVSLHALRLGPATGPDVVVTGRLTREGRPMAGQAVVMQVRTTGTARWRTAKLARTAGDGSVRLTRQSLKRGKQFRVRTTGAPALAVSPVVTVPVASAISVTATSAPTPTAGDEVVLSGSTSAGLVGARVHLQLLVGSEWRSVSSSVVAGDASYSVRSIATIGGDQQYRAWVKAAPGRAETASAAQELTVYAWYRLARSASDDAASASSLVAGRQAIAGTPYVDALGQHLEQGARAISAFELGNRCLAFRATYGPTDDSDAGFYGVFRARADDDVIVDAQLDRGSTRTVRADITGASRLQLISAAATGSGDAAWGDSEVLCAGL